MRAGPGAARCRRSRTAGSAAPGAGSSSGAEGVTRERQAELIALPGAVWVNPEAPAGRRPSGSSAQVPPRPAAGGPPPAVGTAAVGCSAAIGASSLDVVLPVTAPPSMRIASRRPWSALRALPACCSSIAAAIASSLCWTARSDRRSAFLGSASGRVTALVASLTNSSSAPRTRIDGGRSAASHEERQAENRPAPSRARPPGLPGDRAGRSRARYRGAATAGSGRRSRSR